MNNRWDGKSTGENAVARIEEILRGKADGKGYTAEELDTYFSKSRETMEALATKEDFRKGFDQVMRGLNRLLAMATNMANRMERENAEWLSKQQAKDREG